MNASDALRAAVQRLTHAGIDGAARDARLLLAHAMDIAPDRLTLHLHDAPTPQALDRFEQAITQRLKRQPVSQITGQRDFWGRKFRVTPDVLDPRPETETLIAEALNEPFATLLDLGTGSGAIAVTLLAERPLAQGVATDLSPKALEVARTNAQAHGVDTRLTLTTSDWFAKLKGRFDLIVSNPPYISATEMDTLTPEVRDWEPELALTPGGDGLDAYRQIARHALDYLTPKGRILLEIGASQGAAVVSILETMEFADVRIWHDFDGRDRVVGARAPTNSL